jgi:hypothetical protein
MTCPPCTHDCEQGKTCPAKTKQAISELESQEPVAWGVFEGNLHDMFFTQEEAQEMARLKGSHAEVKPLYTHPPQRTEQAKACVYCGQLVIRENT